MKAPHAILQWLTLLPIGGTLLAIPIAATQLISLTSICWICAIGLLASLAIVVVANLLNAQNNETHLLHLEKLASSLADDMDSKNYSGRLAESGLTPRYRSALTKIVEQLQDQEEQIDGLSQRCASSEVKAKIADSKISQVHSVVEELVEPVLVINHYGEITILNQCAKDLLGLADVEIGTDIAKVLRCEPLLQLLNEMRRRKLKSSRVTELEFADPDGEKHWYRVTANTVRSAFEDDSPNDANFGAVAVMRDISGYKAIQRRNAEFVSAVSHEMKTPLAGIKAYVELLADGEAEDEQTHDEFLNVINSQADRLQRLIDNLLNLARIEAGVVSVSKKPRSMNDLLEEAYSIVQPTAEQKNIRLSLELSPMYLGVLADRDMILQAAINLLSNAVKYTPEGGKVTLRSRLADREVQFEVEDTGVGLSPEDCDMVFEKFYRVKKNQKMASGTGLGLPLAKHIVEDVHDGTLKVKSKLGKGSTFTIALPTVQVMDHAH